MALSLPSLSTAYSGGMGNGYFPECSLSRLSLLFACPPGFVFNLQVLVLLHAERTWVHLRTERMGAPSLSKGSPGPRRGCAWLMAQPPLQ